MHVHARFNKKKATVIMSICSYASNRLCVILHLCMQLGDDMYSYHGGGS